jgi:hypothetical protein
MILHVLIAMVAGWLQRQQQQVITYLQEENRTLKAHLGGQRLRLTDTERRRLAALGSTRSVASGFRSSRHWLHPTPCCAGTSD